MSMDNVASELMDRNKCCDHIHGHGSLTNEKIKPKVLEEVKERFDQQLQMAFESVESIGYAIDRLHSEPEPDSGQKYPEKPHAETFTSNMHDRLDALTHLNSKLKDLNRKINGII